MGTNIHIILNLSSWTTKVSTIRISLRERSRPSFPSSCPPAPLLFSSKLSFSLSPHPFSPFFSLPPSFCIILCQLSHLSFPSTPLPLVPPTTRRWRKWDVKEKEERERVRLEVWRERKERRGGKRRWSVSIIDVLKCRHLSFSTWVDVL
jgi:hypothetical protein